MSTVRRHFFLLASAAAGLLALSRASSGQGAPDRDCAASADFGSFTSTWQSTYPGSLSLTNASCALCHETSSGGGSWNAYGWAIRQNLSGMTLAQALAAVQAANSDADPCGEANLGEINHSTQPGWTNGPNNTVFKSNGSTTTGRSAPATVTGLMDPCFPTVVRNGTGINPLVLADTGGNPSLSPRLNSATEPFAVSLDCAGALVNGIYLIQLTASPLATPLATKFGQVLCGGMVLQRFLGPHSHNKVMVGPVTLPNDPALIGIPYCVQGFCSRPGAIGFLSNALDQRIGTL